MEVIFLIIPILISGLVMLIVRDKDPRPMIFSVGFIGVVILFMSLIMRSGNFEDTELLSYYYTKIRHLDEWDEWIEKTCEEEVYVGKDSEGNPIYETRTYDCSYREYHPERWLIYDNRGHTEYTDRETFECLRKLWNTPMRFVDMHRNYYRIDGDAQEYDWCKEWQHLRGTDNEHSYQNRVKGSGSVLRFRDIGESEAKTLGLYEWNRKPVQGLKCTSKEYQRIDYINKYYGKSKQFRLVVLCFPASKGVSVSEDQRAYWQGGKKNELVVCIGLEGRKIKWSNVFSWQDSPKLDVMVRDWLLERGTLDLVALGTYVESNLGEWNRKAFADFNYIATYLTAKQNSAILWTVIALSMCIGILQLFYEHREN